MDAHQAARDIIKAVIFEYKPSYDLAVNDRWMDISISENWPTPADLSGFWSRVVERVEGRYDVPPHGALRLIKPDSIRDQSVRNLIGVLGDEIAKLKRIDPGPPETMSRSSLRKVGWFGKIFKRDAGKSQEQMPDVNKASRDLASLETSSRPNPRDPSGSALSSREMITSSGQGQRREGERTQCPTESKAEVQREATIVRVFYATDRLQLPKVTGDTQYGTDRSPMGTINLGKCEISIPEKHKLGKLEGPSILRLEFSPDPKKHIVLKKTFTLEEQRFFAQVRASVLQSAAKDAFIFVHGYNVSFEDAARRTGQIAYDLNFVGAPIFYSWPSNGRLPITRGTKPTSHGPHRTSSDFWRYFRGIQAPTASTSSLTVWAIARCVTRSRC
jgi:hypothetical protein